MELWYIEYSIDNQNPQYQERKAIFKVVSLESQKDSENNTVCFIDLTCFPEVECKTLLRKMSYTLDTGLRGVKVELAW